MGLITLDGNLLDAEATLRDLDRVACEEDLYTFLQYAWRWFDPSPFTPGWPIEAVAEHLQAVADGEIRRLIINIPPRCAKSSVTSVAFPAWVWAQQYRSATSGPGVQFLSASYAGQLALRDNVKSRRLIESPWYRSLWGERFTLTSDQNTKGRYDNDQGGVRLATSVGAAVTGEGAGIIIIDDPNGAQDATSEAVIESTVEWWDSAMSTRLNDPKTGAYIIIQQRLAEQDLTGHVLEKQAGDWTHLCLPMRFERDRSFVTTIGWQDPRVEEGELLWPERFGPEEVRNLERDLGQWSAAGQLQQRPEPKGGGIVKREWWQPYDQESYPPMSLIIASVDTAYTMKTSNDYSAMTVWGVFSGAQAMPTSRFIRHDGGSVDRGESEDRFDLATSLQNPGMGIGATEMPRVILMQGWAERLELHELVIKIAKTCKEMKVDRLLIENKASGISVAQEMRRLYAHEDWAVQLIDPKGQDKLARLHSISHLFAEGLVHAPDRAWADQVITQTASFPKGKHDDIVDTVSMAMKHLRDIGILVRKPEWAAEVVGGLEHKGAGPPPLYAV